MKKSLLRRAGIEADSYIMIPFHYEGTELFARLTSFDTLRNTEESTHYNKMLIHGIAKLHNAEVSKEMNFGIVRYDFGILRLLVMPDGGDREEGQVEIEARAIISLQETVKIGVLTFALEDMDCDITYLFDQVSRNELLVIEGQEKINLQIYLMDKFGIVKCGNARTLMHMSERPEIEYFKYLLSNEVYQSDITKNACLISHEIEAAAMTNIAQFDFSEIYAYDTCVLQIDKLFDSDYEPRIYKAALTLFLMELMQFREAAVNRVNNRVSAELQDRKNFSVKKIQEINLEFSKSIKFWNLNVFIYPATQKIANRIADAFELDALMEVYKDQKTFLEHLIMTHSIISSEKETKILNYTVLLLTLSQVIPIYFGLYKFIRNPESFNAETMQFVLALASIAAIASLAAVIRLRGLKRRQL